MTRREIYSYADYALYCAGFVAQVLAIPIYLAVVFALGFMQTDQYLGVIGGCILGFVLCTAFITYYGICGHSW